MSLELRPNEYVLIEVHYSYKVFVFPMLLMCIGILMFLAVWAGVFEGVDIHWLRRGVKMSSLMAGLSCVLFVPYIFKRLDNKLKIYAVTNQRVYLRKGIMNINEKDIPLAKINDVQVAQTLNQRMFGAGNVVIQVGNDPASSVYVNNKKKACAYIGIKSLSYELEVPVCYVGTGEKIDDIEDFDAKELSIDECIDEIIEDKSEHYELYCEVYKEIFGGGIDE